MIIAIIPAKGESSRLPNKNMQLLAGKPMIYYSIKAAKESELINAIYVSTDSEEIANYAERQGVKVIKRGPDLGGETPIVEVYYHALKKINNQKIKIIVGIQPDHPDRTLDIDKAISYLLNKDYDEFITVDRNGIANGSLLIMRAETLLSKNFWKVATMMDDCTNIHNLDDLKRVKANFLRRNHLNEKSKCASSLSE